LHKIIRIGAVSVVIAGGGVLIDSQFEVTQKVSNAYQEFIRGVGAMFTEIWSLRPFQAESDCEVPPSVGGYGLGIFKDHELDSKRTVEFGFKAGDKLKCIGDFIPDSTDPEIVWVKVQRSDGTTGFSKVYMEQSLLDYTDAEGKRLPKQPIEEYFRKLREAKK
jgi:hypothetical protein